MNKIDKVLDIAYLCRARTCNLFRGPLSDRIFFLHLPKCGGSSITEAIRHCYVTWDNIAERDLFHLSAAASSQAASKLNFILHDAYSANDFSP